MVSKASSLVIDLHLATLFRDMFSALIARRGHISSQEQRRQDVRGNLLSFETEETTFVYNATEQETKPSAIWTQE